MATKTLTRPQQNALAFIDQVGEATKQQLIGAKLDMRAVNAILNAGLIMHSATGYYCSLPKKEEESPAGRFPVPVPPVFDSVRTDRDVPPATELPDWAKEDKPYKGVHIHRASTERPAPALTKPKKEAMCLCGCGAPSKSMFLQGHDMKLHSAVNQAVKAGGKLQATAAQAAWLSTKAWAQGKYEAAS